MLALCKAFWFLLSNKTARNAKVNDKPMMIAEKNPANFALKLCSNIKAIAGAKAVLARAKIFCAAALLLKSMRHFLCRLIHYCE